MPTQCTICALPDAALHEVNQALIRREPSRLLARRLGLSRDSLVRHARKHLDRALRPAYTEKELSQARDLRQQLEQFRDEATRLKEKAEKKGDLRTALGAIRELCRIVELMAKLGGQLSEPRPTFSTSPSTPTRPAASLKPTCCGITPHLRHGNSQMTEREVMALAAGDLGCYIAALFPAFDLAAHVKMILTKLEAIERAEARRLMLFLPPRHGKSLLASQFFPAWYLGRHPERSIITASYGEELSLDWGRRVRNLLADPLHRAIFADCRLSEDSSAVHRFSTTRGGNYYAVGRGGPITGRGADLLIVDDPIKDVEESGSEIVRRALHSWFSAVCYTRLQPGGALVLIQTRWHESDLAGWLLREHADERWEVISLPAIAEQDETFRREGEALWPERFPLSTLEQIKSAIGGAAWASLYQQRPSAAEGAIFKREWWQFFQPPLAQKVARTVQSWDTAFKAREENDYSVCSTWAATDNGYHLLHLWRGRVEFPELKRMVGVLADEWKPNVVLIEDSASGQSLIQELKAATRLPVLPVKVDRDKVARAQAVTPLIEAGKVFLPSGAAWLNDYIDELATFPHGAHDDQVDSTTLALNDLRTRGREPGIIAWYRQSLEQQGIKVPMLPPIPAA